MERPESYKKKRKIIFCSSLKWYFDEVSLLGRYRIIYISCPFVYGPIPLVPFFGGASIHTEKKIYKYNSHPLCSRSTANDAPRVQRKIPTWKRRQTIWMFESRARFIPARCLNRQIRAHLCCTHARRCFPSSQNGQTSGGVSRSRGR